LEKLTFVSKHSEYILKRVTFHWIVYQVKSDDDFVFVIRPLQRINNGAEIHHHGEQQLPNWRRAAWDHAAH